MPSRVAGLDAAFGEQARDELAADVWQRDEDRRPDASPDRPSGSGDRRGRRTRRATPRIVNVHGGAPVDCGHLIGRHERLEPHARRIDDGEDSVPGDDDVAQARGTRADDAGERRLDVVSSSCCQTPRSRALAAASCASAIDTAFRACSRSRAASAPPLTSASVRCDSLFATVSAVSADFTAAWAEACASSRSRDEIRAMTWPAFDRLAAVDGQRDDRAARPARGPSPRAPA